VRRAGSTMPELIRNTVLIVVVVVSWFFDGCIASTPSTSPAQRAANVNHESSDTSTTSTTLQLGSSYASAMSAMANAAASDTVPADHFGQLAYLNWRSPDGVGSRRMRTPRSCRSWLAGHIEGCLVGYERLLMSTSAYSSKGVSELMASTAGRSVLRHLCRLDTRRRIKRHHAPCATCWNRRVYASQSQ